MQELEFPSVTICGSGSLEGNNVEAMKKQLLAFIVNVTKGSFDEEAFEMEHDQSKGLHLLAMMKQFVYVTCHAQNEMIRN